MTSSARFTPAYEDFVRDKSDAELRALRDYLGDTVPLNENDKIVVCILVAPVNQGEKR